MQCQYSQPQGEVREKRWSRLPNTKCGQQNFDDSSKQQFQLRQEANCASDNWQSHVRCGHRAHKAAEWASARVVDVDLTDVSNQAVSFGKRRQLLAPAQVALWLRHQWLMAHAQRGYVAWRKHVNSGLSACVSCSTVHHSESSINQKIVDKDNDNTHRRLSQHMLGIWPCGHE